MSSTATREASGSSYVKELISQTVARLTRLELSGDVRMTAGGYTATRAGPA